MWIFSVLFPYCMTNLHRPPDTTISKTEIFIYCIYYSSLSSSTTEHLYITMYMPHLETVHIGCKKWFIICPTALRPESIQWFIADQAFSLSYDLSPPPPPSHPPASKLYRRITGRLIKRANLLTGDGEGGWGRGKSSGKSSIKHSILSDRKAVEHINHFLPGTLSTLWVWSTTSTYITIM